MHSKPVNEYPRSVIEQLISVIPFYKQVRQQDNWQFEQLLQHSRVLAFDPGEMVVEKGSEGSWLYFLLKGQLAVLAGDEAQTVNYITPGELFGDLAMLLSTARSASIRADENSREILVFATDFSLFGDLEDTLRVSLATKLIYYRNLLHSLRWKLEVYRSKYPEHPLADQHRSVKLYRGDKDTRDELLSLHEQACRLGELLVEWNRAFGRLTLVDNQAPAKQLLAEISG
ncbi:cyclic nucleotide-binding domain-containing protein [Pseudomaricurvus sp.]|uniref:cyclic nucleotide-binding domain-containing protein n=1 Tax=Pseudomaricurvus sp. TaxID=2004510 RepID=UPI003F6D4B57